MPDQDDKWFDQLADASRSNDPLINAVRDAAGRIDPVVDDLALARLKRRLRVEGLLESRSQRFVRQFSPPIASAAVILLCFSVLLQSGLVSFGSQQQNVQYSLEPAADSPLADADVEYFDQSAKDEGGSFQSAEQEPRLAPMPQSAPLPPSLSRDQTRAAAQAQALQEQRERLDQRKRAESRLRAESMRQLESEESSLDFADDAWNEPIAEALGSEKALRKEEKATHQSVARRKQAPRIVIELDTEEPLSEFDAFRVEQSGSNIDSDEVVVECQDTASCAELNSLLGRQAAWLLESQIAKPGIVITLRRLR
jgi:hypothetical protein